MSPTVRTSPRRIPTAARLFTTRETGSALGTPGRESCSVVTSERVIKAPAGMALAATYTEVVSVERCSATKPPNMPMIPTMSSRPTRIILRWLLPTAEADRVLAALGWSRRGSFAWSPRLGGRVPAGGRPPVEAAFASPSGLVLDLNIYFLPVVHHLRDQSATTYFQSLLCRYAEKWHNVAFWQKNFENSRIFSFGAVATGYLSRRETNERLYGPADSIEARNTQWLLGGACHFWVSQRRWPRQKQHSDLITLTQACGQTYAGVISSMWFSLSGFFATPRIELESFFRQCDHEALDGLTSCSPLPMHEVYCLVREQSGSVAWFQSNVTSEPNQPYGPHNHGGSSQNWGVAEVLDSPLPHH